MGLGVKTVGTIPTIPAPGEPPFVNISINNHGELNSRETCRLLRPTSQNLSSISLNTPMTRTRTPKMMSEHVGAKFGAMDGGKLASSLVQDSYMINSSCLAVSDELNTPEIGLNCNGFKFSHYTDTENQPIVGMTDVPEMPVWGDMPPIAINAPEEQQPLTDILGWSSRPTELKLKLHLNPPQRPAELKLKLQATPIPFVDTPNVVLDTPDVFKQLVYGGHPTFDLLDYVLDEKTAGSLDSPQISSTSKLDVNHPNIKQEEPPVDNGSTNYVTSTSQEVEEVHQQQIEFVSIPIEVPAPIVPATRKRTYSRRASAEAVKYQFSDSEDSNSTTVSSKRPRILSKIKEEREEEESSIAGSATEFKYHELRVRNNEASRRSRHNRKQRETEMESEREALEAKNRLLHAKVNEIEHLVTVMRKALLDRIREASKNK